MRGHLIVSGGRKKVVFGKLGSLGSSMKKLYHCRHGRMLASSFRASAYLFTPQRIGSQENRWNGIGMGLCHLWPLLLLPQPDTCTPLPPHFLQLFRRGGGSSRLDTTCALSLSLSLSLSRIAVGVGVAAWERRRSRSMRRQRTRRSQLPPISAPSASKAGQYSVPHPLSTPLLC